MKKTVCTILLTLFVNMDSVGMIGIGDRRLLPYSSPFFVTQVNDFIPTSEDETEDSSEHKKDVSHSCVTFKLGVHGETAFISRALSPLPPVLPRSGSCCFSSSEKNENNDINPSIDLLQNEPLCSSPSKNKLLRSPSNYDLQGDYPFKETRYSVMRWNDFQKMLYEAKKQAFSSKALASGPCIPKALTILVMRHAKDAVGPDMVHGPEDVCHDVYISGNERDDLQNFRASSFGFKWALCSSEDERNKKTLKELFPDCEPILDSDFNETYVPEFTGIPKKRIASHADCRKMLKVPTYKTPSANESVDSTAARVLNKLSTVGNGFNSKKILFCSNSFVMNSIVSLFNKNKELVKFENLHSILIRIYGDYITAFTDQEGAVKVFSPRDLSSVYDVLYPSSISY